MDLTPITVIVEEKSFSTNKNSLLSSGFFRGMMEVEPDTTSLPVPNRSKKTFKHVLCYLIDNKYPFPKKYRYELDFYDVEYDEKNLYDPYSDIIKELDKIRNDQKGIVSRLDKLENNQKAIVSKLSKHDKLLTELKEVDISCKMCSNDKCGEFDYCYEHKCRSDNCPSRRKDGTDYCDSHRCTKPGCNEEIYCDWRCERHFKW